MLSERERIFRTLSRRERRLLAEYESEHGCRLYGNIIYSVVRRNKNVRLNTPKGGELAIRRK